MAGSMQVVKLVLLLVLVHVVASSVLSTDDGTERAGFVAKNRRRLEHSHSGLCLLLHKSGQKLQLDKCGTSDREGVFSVIKSNRGGHMMKIGGGCLEIGRVNSSDEVDELVDEDDEQDNEGIRLSPCDPRDPALNWEFRRVEFAKYNLRKMPSGLCLAPSGQDGGVHMVSCTTSEEGDKVDDELTWRICEDLDYTKCDV